MPARTLKRVSRQDFRCGPIAAATVSTDPPAPPFSSFILSGTLTDAILAVPRVSAAHCSSVWSVRPARAETAPLLRPLQLIGPLSPWGSSLTWGCQPSRSMRATICRKRRRVKWLSASGKVKYRARRMSRPPVLKSRCWRLVRDQLWMAKGKASRLGPSHGRVSSRLTSRMRLVHRARDMPDPNA